MNVIKIIKFFCLNSKKKDKIFIFKIFLFLNIIHYGIFETCNNRDIPYLLNGVCVESCGEDNSNSCILDNEIIKTQYLNNIIYIENINIEFYNIEVSENNNLYFFLSEYPQSNVRTIYMLNNKGYGLLNENDPIYNNNINDPSGIGRYEADIFTFRLLSDTDDKEYLISITKCDQLMEIYDFGANKVYFTRTMDFFDIIAIYTIIGTHIKLKNKKNYYLVGLLASEYENGKTNYVYLKKGCFSKLDISNSNDVFDTKKLQTTEAQIISCYETSSNFIVCFYQDPEFKYTMIVFDYDLNEKKHTTIAEGIEKAGYENLFFKCIHFFEDTGVFGYFSNDANPLMVFKFKKYINNNNLIQDNYESITQLSINDILFNYTSSITSCDMIKIEDKKFYFLGLSLSQEILYIVSIYNYYQEKFSIRIYSINFLKTYNFIISTKIRTGLYKNFFVLGAKNYNYCYISLIIFSYPNTNEANLDIMDYLYNNDEIKIDNLMLKLNGEYILENNLFGYVFSGIQIFENCNDLEDIYLVNSDNERISNYFLPKNEEIKLLIPYNDLYSPFICTIKYTTVVSEPDFSEFKKYPININYIGGNENDNNLFFHKNYYIGKVNNFNLILNETLTTINCMDNCELCDNNNIGNCVTCKYSSNINSHNNNA